MVKKEYTNKKFFKVGGIDLLNYIVPVQSHSVAPWTLHFIINN